MLFEVLPNYVVAIFALLVIEPQKVGFGQPAIIVSVVFIVDFINISVSLLRRFLISLIVQLRILYR